MDAQSTSRAESGRAGLVRFVPRMWRELADFVTQPRLPEGRERFGLRAIGEVAQLWALDVAVSFVLVVGLSWLATRLAITTPKFEELTRYGPVVTLLAGALGLPILEECVFRSWLSGRPKMLALVLVLIGTVLSLAVLTLTMGPGHYLAMALILLGCIVVAAVVARRVRGETPGWFRRAFPWLFYASSLAFGLAHMSNYDLSRPWLLLPFVVPQLVAGTVFGFARVRYGMWANITLHATSNALFLGLSLSGL